MLSRRDLLRGAGLLGAAAGLGACSTSGGGTVASGGPTEDATRTEPASPTQSKSPKAALPRTKPWQPAPAEVAPRVKLQATRLVEAVASWESGQGSVAAARERLAAGGFDPGLVSQLGPLLGPGEAAAAEIRVAQYGGILESSASVLVVVDQWLRKAGRRVVAGGTTLDIRLTAATPRWQVTQVRPARPGSPAQQLPRATRRLLDNDRILVPYAAAADLRAGVVRPSVVNALSDLSRDFMVGVSILRSGHPIRVFGTDRRSSHTDGLAVDVWSVDGRSVIKATGSRLVADFMRAAAETGAFQVGGPQNLDGLGRQYFSDATHQDHIHIGYTAAP